MECSRAEGPVDFSGQGFSLESGTSMAGILFIISAPSGSGKSTIVSQLRTLVAGLDFSISYTTRPPRGSETEGLEYHFTTRDEFERMIAAGDFLEWAEVFGELLWDGAFGAWTRKGRE